MPRRSSQRAPTRARRRSGMVVQDRRRLTLRTICSPRALCRWLRSHAGSARLEHRVTGRSRHRGTTDPARTHLQVPLRGTCLTSRSPFPPVGESPPAEAVDSGLGCLVHAAGAATIPASHRLPGVVHQDRRAGIAALLEPLAGASLLPLLEGQPCVRAGNATSCSTSRENSHWRRPPVRPPAGPPVELPGGPDAVVFLGCRDAPGCSRAYVSRPVMVRSRSL